jgi:diketogulonate reductase-like aldo/keto reductase
MAREPKSAIRRVRARTGAEMPVLGLGTWEMGERTGQRKEEVAALRLGLDLGMTLIDTAEMYGSGGAEEVVGEAIRGRRDAVFVVTKVLPQNASREGTERACERSLGRLRTDRIDLYLLHWPGRHPLAATLEAFERLRSQGKIRHYGVSNVDHREMAEAETMPGGAGIACDQVLYNLARRGIERNLLPWCRNRGVVVMAYSPFDQGRLRERPALARVASRHGVGRALVALAWTIREEGVVTIPKASDPEHVRENARAAGLRFTPDDLAELDRAYPAPPRDIPLETA